MSAILNTLKKLEEEKSVFEQNLDVQDLALHHEFGSTSSFFQISRKRNNLLLILLAFIFTIIVVSLFFYFKSTKFQSTQKLVSNGTFGPTKNSGFNKIMLPKNTSVSGISATRYFFSTTSHHPMRAPGILIFPAFEGTSAWRVRLIARTPPE